MPMREGYRSKPPARTESTFVVDMRMTNPQCDSMRGVGLPPNSASLTHFTRGHVFGVLQRTHPRAHIHSYARLLLNLSQHGTLFINSKAN